MINTDNNLDVNTNEQDDYDVNTVNGTPAFSLISGINSVIQFTAELPVSIDDKLKTSSKKFIDIYNRIRNLEKDNNIASPDKLPQYIEVIPELINKLNIIIDINLDKEHFEKYLKLDNPDKEVEKSIKLINAQERREFYIVLLQTFISSLKEINIFAVNCQNIEIKDDNQIKADRQHFNQLIALKLLDQNKIVKKCDELRLEELIENNLKELTDKPVENNLCELLKRVTVHLGSLDNKVNLYNPVIKAMVLAEQQITFIKKHAQNSINTIIRKTTTISSNFTMINISGILNDNRCNEKINKINESKEKHINGVKLFIKHFFIGLTHSESDVIFLKKNAFNIARFANTDKHTFKTENNIQDWLYKIDKTHGKVRKEWDHLIAPSTAKIVKYVAIPTTIVVVGIVGATVPPILLATASVVATGIIVLNIISKIQAHHSAYYKIDELEGIFKLEEILLLNKLNQQYCTFIDDY